MVYQFKVIFEIPEKEEVEEIQKIIFNYNEDITSEIYAKAFKYISESSDDEIIIEHPNKETLDEVQRDISNIMESIFSQYNDKLIKFGFDLNQWEAVCTEVSEVQNYDEIPSLQNNLQLREEMKVLELKFLEQFAKKHESKLKKYKNRFKDEEMEIKKVLEKVLQDVNSILESI